MANYLMKPQRGTKKRKKKKQTHDKRKKRKRSINFQDRDGKKYKKEIRAIERKMGDI